MDGCIIVSVNNGFVWNAAENKRYRNEKFECIWAELGKVREKELTASKDIYEQVGCAEVV